MNEKMYILKGNCKKDPLTDASPFTFSLDSVFLLIPRTF